MMTLLLGLFLSVGAFAQQITVKGHVKDSAGEPVIGATIRVVGTQTGVISDFDGNFQIKANQGQTLNVTYIGYQPANVSAAPNVVVTLLDDAQTLENVVVIGYGRAKKSDLTGSVTAIKPDELNHGLQTNAQDMLQGKIAGVNVVTNSGEPGAGAQIRIRGGSSLNASNDPLIVIDGLAMDNNGIEGVPNALAMVNPNDIETFTVLKDASATAIYGSRASNGVIIITTKKGRSGTGPKVSYNGNVSIAQKKDLIDVMDGTQYTQFIKDLYGEGSEAYNALGYLDKQGNKQYANTDWQDEVYRTAVSTDHNVTVTGGAKNMPYRFSVGYTNNQGIVKTSKFERYTASINLSPSLGEDHLKLNINAKGMYSKNRFANTDAMWQARQMDPTKPIKADNDIYNKYFGGYAQWYSPASYPGDTEWVWGYNRNATGNPVASLELTSNTARAKSFVGNFEADYAIHGFEDLHLHMNAGMNISSGKSRNETDPVNKTNNYYYGYHGWNTKDTYNYQLSFYAQYTKDFADIHHLDVMAGHEWQDYHIKTDWAGYGLYPRSNDSYGQHYDEKPADGNTNVYKSANYLESWFGRLNYTLADRYLLTFTLRADGSSRFNWYKSADNQQWGYFPSAAFAWRINEEGFMKNLNAVNDFKLRLGWGVTGQQDGIGDYTYIPSYTPTSNTHALYPVVGTGLTYRPDAYNNQLTWETTTTYNAGIDLALWNNRVVFAADWYYRKTKDLINTVFVPAGSNFKERVMSNIGSLHNTGLEFALTLRPIQTKDWQWEVNYNITYNKNEIDELVTGEGADYFVETGGISAGTGGTIQGHAVGHPVSAFRVFQQVYDEAGNPIENTFVDRNGNGYIDDNDKYYYYKPAPDVTMGFSSKLQYKNWDLGFNLRASLGNYVYNDNFSGQQNVGQGAIYTLAYLVNRPLDDVKLGFRSPLTNQYYSDYFVQNASFLKLDNITLGYNFATLFGAKISGRIYGTVQNVLTITKYDGIDPEVASGIDNNIYPRPFTTVLGLNLNF
jgi:iron complex outermembrane receptor protein